MLDEPTPIHQTTVIKFFRKIRQKTLTENKFGRYLTYAIGEIVLVAIGILIALQINNWNENKKSKSQLHNIYAEVALNLQSDLSNLDTVIAEYEGFDLLLDTMISDEYSIVLLESINDSNYSDCIPCQGMINSFYPFEFIDKGVSLLKAYNDYNAKGNKDLTNDIFEFYKNAETLKLIIDMLKDEAFNNLKYFEQFAWYSDLMKGQYNSEMMAFFANDTVFKNKVLTYRLLAIGNYLSDLRAYKKSAIILLEKIKIAEQA